MFSPIRKVAQAYKRNALLETAVIAFCLGLVAMAAVAMMVHAHTTTHSAAEYAFGLHLLVVHVAFHLTEFVVAAVQRPRETYPEAFMIFHSPAYLAANAMSLVEFLLEVFVVPDEWKLLSSREGEGGGSLLFLLFRLNMGAATVYGILAAVCYGIRVAAMIQCGPNFSLMIEQEKRREHRLIRTGLYSVLRHPAYFGWFWRIPFSQMMLANPICTLLHTAVTWVFFRHRIPYEERLLESDDFFGEEYRTYKATTTNKGDKLRDFAAMVLNADKNNLIKYATSVHFFPIVISAGIAPAIYMSGHPNLAMISLYGGLALMAFVTWLSPILTLKPVCGAYRPSFKELRATKDSEGNGCPPVTLVYPTTEELKEVTHWLPFQDHSYLKGMADYVHMPFILVRDMQLTQMAAHVDAKPHPLFRKDGSQRPIFVFSHGLAGFSRLYSTFLTSVAAQGAIVVAVEHMDRSAAFCRDASNDFRIPLDTNVKWTYYDRVPQLRVRVQEVRNTVAEVLNGNILRQLGISEAEVQQYVDNKPQVVLMGHSFGGATMLAVAHEEEKKMRAKKDNCVAAIAAVIAYDPWCVPLWGRFMKALPGEGAEPTGELLDFKQEDATYSTPTLLHHSEAWRRDKDFSTFFEKLDKAMHAQVGVEGLLHPEQRKRIEEANARMAKAMAPPEAKSANTAAPDAAEAEPAAADGEPAAEDWFITHYAPETGHLSVTDMSFLSPVVFKKKYETNRPEAPIHQWANEVMRFAEIHVEKNMKL